MTIYKSWILLYFHIWKMFLFLQYLYAGKNNVLLTRTSPRTSVIAACWLHFVSLKFSLRLHRYDLYILYKKLFSPKSEICFVMKIMRIKGSTEFQHGVFFTQDRKKNLYMFSFEIYSLNRHNGEENLYFSYTSFTSIDSSDQIVTVNQVECALKTIFGFTRHSTCTACAHFFFSCSFSEWAWTYFFIVWPNSIFFPTATFLCDSESVWSK